ncbi:hypothetical protein LZ31DRAFT_154303 [Colletotrichum somersetense]|nr:hypothetical protein LZ31DRAFT_154303 [Colletotrichum somersetense]
MYRFPIGRHPSSRTPPSVVSFNTCGGPTVGGGSQWLGRQLIGARHRLRQRDEANVNFGDVAGCAKRAPIQALDVGFGQSTQSTLKCHFAGQSRGALVLLAPLGNKVQGSQPRPACLARPGVPPVVNKKTECLDGLVFRTKAGMLAACLASYVSEESLL